MQMFKITNLLSPLWFIQQCTFYFSGSKAPKTDPAVGQAALAQAETAKQAFNFYTQEYERYRPRMENSLNLADEVTKFQLDSSKQNAAIADEFNDYAMETFRPIEKQLIDQAKDYNTTGRQEAEAGKGIADVKQAFQVQRGQATRNNERMGINPNSGNAQSLQASMDVQEAIASANAANKGRTTTEQTGRAMLADAALMGRGLASNQATSTQIASRQAEAGQNANSVGNQQFTNGLNIQGQGYQTSIQGNQSAANILNQDYQNRVNSFNASNAADAANAQGWGTAAGLALSLAEGGRVDEAAGLEPIEEPKAEGRIVGAGTEVSDSIPARLSKNEGVLNAGALKIMDKMFGLEAFDNLNKAGLALRSAA